MMPPRFPKPPAATPTQDDINSFCNAAKTGDVPSVTGYLDRFGASIINERDNSGDTALTWAAWTGQKAVVELLLARGADIDKKGMTDRTALGWAAHGGRRDVVELLLDKGANTDIRDRDNKSPADLAANAQHASLAAYIRENGSAKRKAAFEEAAKKKSEEEGKALANERLENLKKHKPPKLKP